MSFVSLITPDTKIKVSSTLDKSVGKKYLVDGSPETCWTSQQGLPQYIQLAFTSPVIPRRISFTFQGGFVGSRCAVHASAPSSSIEWRLLDTIYPEDINAVQHFLLKESTEETLAAGVQHLKLIFEESSDFFGRVTVYDLRVEGELPS